MYLYLKIASAMPKFVSVLAVCSCTLVLLNCTKESAVVQSSADFSEVDTRLVPFFQSFAYEAGLRGVNVDYRDLPIIGYIREIPENNIAGTCNYHSYEPNVVTVDQAYWNASSSLGREMVVFHELGHCYLGRDHLEKAFANGICASIMNSGTSGCYMAYNSTNRDYYLDELFTGGN